MVLSGPGGIAARGGPPVRARPPGRPARLGAEERGSQTLELALLLPVLAILLGVLVQGGLAASELVLAHAVARDAARVAAVDDDRAALEAARAVAGDRAVEVRAEPPQGRRRGGELVTVHVRLRSVVLERLGVQAWLPAEATMRVEGP